MVTASQRFGDFLPVSGSNQSPVSMISASNRAIPTQNAYHSMFSPPEAVKPSVPNRGSHTPRRIARNLQSPMQETAVSSLGGSPFSAVSRWTSGSTSYKGLPSIDMIGFDYIQQCRSLDELRQIIVVLRTEPKCTSLLKAALARQGLLANKNDTPEGFVVTPISEEHRVHFSKRPTEIPNQSLNMSLSSDESSLPRSTVALDREYKLYQQIQNLTARLKEQDQKHRLAEASYLEKIKEMKSDDNLTKQLSIARSQNQATQNLLQLEQARYAESNAKVQSLEEQLSQKLDELASMQQACAEGPRLQQVLEAAQKELEHVKSERDGMMKQLMGDDSENQTVDGVKLVSNLIKENQMAKSTVRILEQQAVKVELGHQRELEMNSRLKLSLEKSQESNVVLKRENTRLLKQVKKLTSELGETRTKLQQTIESRRENREWKEKESMYQNTIRSLEQKIENSESTVPIKLYKSEVTRGRHLAETVDKLETELRSLKPEDISRGFEPSSHPKTPTRSVAFQPVLETPVARSNVVNTQFMTGKSLDLSRRIRRLSPTPSKGAKKKVPAPPPPRVSTEFKFIPLLPVNGQGAKVLMRPQRKVEPAKENLRPKRVTIVATESAKHSAPLKNVSFSPVAKSMGKSQVRMNLLKRGGGKKLGLQEKFRQVRSPHKAASPLQESNCYKN